MEQAGKGRNLLTAGQQIEPDLIEVATFLGDRFGITWSEFRTMPMILIWAYWEWGVYYATLDTAIRAMSMGA